jgi:hypothetical protein
MNYALGIVSDRRRLSQTDIREPKLCLNRDHNRDLADSSWVTLSINTFEVLVITTLGSASITSLETSSHSVEGPRKSAGSPTGPIRDPGSRRRSRGFHHTAGGGTTLWSMCEVLRARPSVCREAIPQIETVTRQMACIDGKQTCLRPDALLTCSPATE